MAESYTTGRTRKLYDADGKLVREESIDAMPLTEGEMVLADVARRQEMRSVLGTTAAAGLAQGAIPYVFPTAQDTRNKEKLAELQRREKAGLLGKNAQEDVFLEASLMNPVRGLATQQTQRGEAERASMGGTRSAREALQAQKAERQVVAQAAQQAGLKKAERYFQRKAAETQELEQRTAYESEKKKNTLEMLGNTIAGLSGLAGKYMAAEVQETVTPDQLDAFLRSNPRYSGMSPQEILTAYRNSRRGTPGAKEATMLTAEVGGPEAGGAPGTSGAVP
jgi:hypothetical protein